ncbi:hypothetical protein L1987_50347 [Smallanthus sonchifolius]|uniref:Uncharacterized protein n=1 Tax=Smallanthus sonchifolius TaxID=185202 RepID=A0ACB9EMC5_9ASTR|nr:hypothetical protein L1987_50347 [Smallanthus sonchifolius]
MAGIRSLSRSFGHPRFSGCWKYGAGAILGLNLGSWDEFGCSKNVSGELRLSGGRNSGAGANDCDVTADEFTGYWSRPACEFLLNRLGGDGLVVGLLNPVMFSPMACWIIVLLLGLMFWILSWTAPSTLQHHATISIHFLFRFEFGELE